MKLRESVKLWEQRGCFYFTCEFGYEETLFEAAAALAKNKDVFMIYEMYTRAFLFQIIDGDSGKCVSIGYGFDNLKMVIFDGNFIKELN